VAKKRRKEKEKEKEVFKKPEFDEVEYMKKEISNTRIAMITIIFAIPIAIVSYLVTLANLAIFGFLIGVACIFFLKYVYGFLKVDTSEFEKKDWLGNAAMFFFTWLAIWVLVLNMPFSDLTKPTVSNVQVEGCTLLTGSNRDYSCDLGANLSKDYIISSRATDNAGVRNVRIRITSSSVTDEFGMQKSVGSNEYSHVLTVEKGVFYSFEIVAEDGNAHTRVVSGYTISGD
jgi:hypothetical protein